MTTFAESTSSDPSAESELTGALIEAASVPWRAGERREERETPIDWGVYRGSPPKLQLEDDGRRVTLLSPLSYVDPGGLAWAVPEGAAADGASIPRPFWSIIGGPFEGRYRNASIVHDRFCDHRVRTWRDTHVMFHQAMRCSGTPSVQARIMFYAVYRFGPRWPDPGTEAPSSTERWFPPIDAMALAADARAIAEHDLTEQEIQALAEARDREAARDGTELPSPAAGADARLVVIAGGRGGPDDLETVASAAAHLPAPVIRRFRRKDVRIVACRDSVTDFERDLKGVVPRGWDDLGKTWDDVPGAYLPKRKRVVIATVASAAGNRVVPRMGHGHGSADLVVHEALHGFDYSGGHAVLTDPAFVEARRSDFDRLGAYERQDGQAGAEETFAESGARFAVEREEMQQSWPHLASFWEAGPLETEHEGFGEEEALAHPAAIGTARDAGGGRIEVDLRADGPDDIIGHASFVLGPGDAGYERIAERAFAEGPDSGRAVLVFPLVS